MHFKTSKNQNSHGFSIFQTRIDFYNFQTRMEFSFSKLACISHFPNSHRFIQFPNSHGIFIFQTRMHFPFSKLEQIYTISKLAWNFHFPNAHAFQFENSHDLFSFKSKLACLWNYKLGRIYLSFKSKLACLWNCKTRTDYPILQKTRQRLTPFTSIMLR